MRITRCSRAQATARKICDTFISFEDAEQSKIFPNAAFGYWKVTVDRPLRLKGIEPDRIYAAKEIKALKETAERAESAPPVIKKIHKKGTASAPVRGLFAVAIDGKPAVVEYEPDPDLRDTEQVPLLEEGGSRNRNPTAPAALDCLQALHPATHEPKWKVPRAPPREMPCHAVCHAQIEGQRRGVMGWDGRPKL